MVGRLVRQAYPIDKAHHYHGALSVHVTDPDGYGIELSYDRPRFDANKRLVTKTGPFDVRGLLIDATADTLDLYDVAARAIDRQRALEVA